MLDDEHTPESLLDVGQISARIGVPRFLVPTVLDHYNCPASGQYKGRRLWLACLVESALAVIETGERRAC